MNHGYPDELIIGAIPGKVQCPYRPVIITKDHTFSVFVQISQWEFEKQKTADPTQGRGRTVAQAVA